MSTAPGIEGLWVRLTHNLGIVLMSILILTFIDKNQFLLHLHKTHVPVFRAFFLFFHA